ncbi:MAG: type 4a pilus biogenesis protein PilO [FCB group bacterium]|nr:type 4a pilus biogenesis protein PilO [FCB group bacterium]
MKVNARQILALGFLAVIASIVAWYFFMYQAQVNKIYTIQTEISQLNGQLSRSNVSINSLPSLKASVSSMVEEFDSLSMKLPTKDQVSTMVNDIVEAALTRDLTIDKISPAIQAMLESPNYFVKVPIEIEINGSYLNFGMFIESLYQLPFHIYISNLSLNRSDDHVTVIAKMSAYFYVINPGGKI